MAGNLLIAAGGERRCLLAQRPDQPELIECRRTQAVDEPADIGDRGLDARRCPVEQVVDGCGIAGDQRDGVGVWVLRRKRFWGKGRSQTTRW